MVILLEEDLESIFFLFHWSDQVAKQHSGEVGDDRNLRVLIDVAFTEWNDEISTSL